MGKCQHDAGILKNNELTEAAKNKFIEDVKSHLLMGSENAPALPIPCGPELPPVPNADRIELENEALYPEWHAYALGYYRDLARALDLEGQFTVLPICDPIALGFKLGLDPAALDFPGEFALVGLVLPLLAAHLELLPPIELALKFPDLLSVGLPQFDIPEFPLSPLEFPELFKFAFPFLKFPELLLGLMGKMPSLFLKLLKFDFSAPCDVVLDAGLFGPFDPNEAIIWAVTQKVLAAKVAECLTIALIGSTVGSAPAGMTGFMGGKQMFGYTPPEQPVGEKPPIRDTIVAQAHYGDGLAWSKDHADFKAKGYSLEEATFKYTNFLQPNWIFPSPPEVPYVHKNTLLRINQTFTRAQKQSCCGMFVRVCYYYAGATYHPFFTKPYQPASAVARLGEIANKVGARIDYGLGSAALFVPAMKRGDAIIVQTTTANPAQPEAGTEHVLMLVEDYPGGFDGTVRTVEGGQADFENTAAPNGSAIRASVIEFKKLPNGSISASAIGDPAPRSIIFIMNGWSMVTGLPKEDEGKPDTPK